MDSSPEKTENIYRPELEPSDEDTEFGLGSYYRRKDEGLKIPNPENRYEPVPSLTDEKRAALRRKAEKMSEEVEERLKVKRSKQSRQVEAEIRGLAKSVPAIEAQELELDLEEHREYVDARQQLEIKRDELDEIKEEIRDLSGKGLEKLWHWIVKPNAIKSLELRQTTLKAEIEGLSAIAMDFEAKIAAAKEAKEKAA